MLKCVAACCSVMNLGGAWRCCRSTIVDMLPPASLQCVAVRSSVLQCVAVCCSVLQRVAVWYSALQCDAVRCSVL